MPDSIVFLGAKRTPFGSFGGSFLHFSATELGVSASLGALGEAGVDPKEVDHVFYGNVIQSSPDAAYLARHIGLKAGISQSAPALTLNRLCGSGFEAIVQGARLLELGLARCVLVGGTENMSQSPYVLRDSRFGYRMGHGKLEDSLQSGLHDAYANMPMGITAENLGRAYGITRAQADEYGVLSQQRAFRAQKKGLFDDEIAPVTLTTKKGEVTVSQDEGIRPDTTLEKIQKLKPVFEKEGTVTAGNASGISDGAASLVMSTASFAKERGLTPLGTYRNASVVGVDPKIMGIGPVEACQRSLKEAGLGVQDIAHLEVNEAFATQYLAVEKELGAKRDKTNPNGGAIALGHPLAASGARIITHQLHHLKHLGGGYGLGSACIGGGQGIAVLIHV